MPLQILFVDDSVTMQRAMQITFSREDAQVICVANGAGALARARDSRPDVIVVDVTLEQGDGYSVCQSLKAEPDLAQVPVMLLANKQNPIDEAKVAACGAQGHAVKPFDTQTMVDKVRALANLPPVAAPAAWTPRPAAAPVAQAKAATPPAAPPPTPRPVPAAPQVAATPPVGALPAAPAQAGSATPAPAATSVAGSNPAQVAPRPVVQTPPAAPPPQRPSAPQPMAGGWSMTPAPAGSGPPPSPPRAPVPRTGAPVSGAPPAAFHAPPAAARQGLPPRSPHAGMAQTASQVAAHSVGQALHKAGIPVDQAALMSLAREIIERVAWGSHP